MSYGTISRQLGDAPSKVFHRTATESICGVTVAGFICVCGITYKAAVDATTFVNNIFKEAHKSASFDMDLSIQDDECDEDGEWIIVDVYGT